MSALDRLGSSPDVKHIEVEVRIENKENSGANVIRTGSGESIVERLNTTGDNTIKKRDNVLDTTPEVKKTGCGCKATTVIKWVAIAAAIALFVIALLALLIYINQLQVGWAGVGMMSAPIALYIMLGGFGLSFIIAILVGVSQCPCLTTKPQENAQHQKEAEGPLVKPTEAEADKKPWHSFLTSCWKKDSTTNQDEVIPVSTKPANPKGKNPDPVENLGHPPSGKNIIINNEEGSSSDNA